VDTHAPQREASAAAVAACRKPGASVAAVTLELQLNAKLLQTLGQAVWGKICNGEDDRGAEVAAGDSGDLLDADARYAGRADVGPVYCGTHDPATHPQGQVAYLTPAQ
jgi:hypothetical protein